MAARAIAGSNIALAKYWGKSDVRLNLPAVPSISMTLDTLTTETVVEFGSVRKDRVTINGKRATPKEKARVVELLERVRAKANIREAATVVSRNNFPTAAGLASSASGFAALAAASLAAAGVDATTKRVSRFARQSSASAARSVFGGFAELPAGMRGDSRLCAKPLFGPSHWKVALVVAVTAKGPKKVGSTVGMERSRKTSPLYAAWLEKAPGLARKVRSGLRNRDLSKLGAAMEQSTTLFHSCAMSALPPIYYWQPPTLAVLHAVSQLREAGVEVYATMDAGPHVKALCLEQEVRRVARRLKKVEGVLEVLVARPGSGLLIDEP